MTGTGTVLYSAAEAVSRWVRPAPRPDAAAVIPPTPPGSLGDEAMVVGLATELAGGGIGYGLSSGRLHRRATAQSGGRVVGPGRLMPAFGVHLRPPRPPWSGRPSGLVQGEVVSAREAGGPFLDPGGRRRVSVARSGDRGGPRHRGEPVGGDE